MATMFVRQPGTVIAVNTGAQTGNLLVIGDLSANAFSNFGAIVTGFGLETESGIQVIHALQKAIFIHSFGERIGNLVVSGLAPSRSCDGTIPGIDGILQYYDNLRISNSGQAYPIVIGTSRFMGIIHGLRLGLSNPELQLGEFVLRLKVFKDQA